MRSGTTRIVAALGIFAAAFVGVHAIAGRAKAIGPIPLSAEESAALLGGMCPSTDCQCQSNSTTCGLSAKGSTCLATAGNTGACVGYGTTNTDCVWVDPNAQPGCNLLGPTGSTCQLVQLSYQCADQWVTTKLPSQSCIQINCKLGTKSTCGQSAYQCVYTPPQP